MRQRGQSLVEFAFVLPMFALFLFGLIYGGIMFLQYFNLSNESRAEARRIAVMTANQRNNYFAATEDNYPNSLMTAKVIENPERFGKFYAVQQKIWVEYGTDENGVPEPVDVIVRVEFNRDDNDDLPFVLSGYQWPPLTFAMEYRMQLERDDTEEP